MMMMMALRKKLKPLIINRPEAMPPWRKGVEWTITTVGWLIWVILCRPLVIMFLWFLGFKIFYTHMIRLGGWHGIVDALTVYLVLILFITLSIRSWNIYNLWKFRDKDRRKKNKTVTSLDIAHLLNISPEEVPRIQDSPNISIDFLPENGLRFSISENDQIPPILARYQTQPISPKK